ncbi:hypothetical protein SNF32_07745 [Enterococcus mundtii]|nr:hypothetical protein [Enterococcus mundtii]
MKPVPAYIDAAPADIQLVSVVAASLAAEYDPESRFIIKKSSREIRKQFWFH